MKSSQSTRRVIALGRDGPSAGRDRVQDLERDLTPLGFVGFLDPVRRRLDRP